MTPDNVPGPEGAPPPLTDSTSRPPGTHHTLPSSKTASSGRVVVTLASLAKTPPPVTAEEVPSEFPALPSKSGGFILPAKETSASLQQRLPTPSGRLPQSARPDDVKLPPKTGALPNFAGRLPGTGSETTPPPLPGKKKRLLPSFNFKSLARGFNRSDESILVDPTSAPEKKEGKTASQMAEKIPEAKADDLQSLADFRSTPAPEPGNAAPLPPPVVEKIEPALPPPLPLPRTLASPHHDPSPASLSVAPPMTDASVHAHGEKHHLPPPVHETHREEAFAPLPRVPGLAEPPRSAAPLKLGASLSELGVEAAPAVVPPPLPVVVPAMRESAHALRPASPMDEKPAPSEPVPTLPPVLPMAEAVAAAAAVEALRPVPAPVEPPAVIESSPAVVEPGAPPVASAKSLGADVPWPAAQPPYTPLRLDPPRNRRLPKTAPPTEPRTAEPPTVKLPAPEPVEPSVDVPVAPPAAKAFASTVLPTRLRNAPPKEAPPLPVVETTVLASTVPEAISPPVVPMATPEASPKEVPLPVPGLKLPGVPPSAITKKLDGPEPDAPVPPVKSARARKRRLIGAIIFYLFFAAILPALYFMGLHYGSETRIEGQVVPPPGTTLNNQVWIVSDFRELAAGIADDLANERAPKLQEIQERQDHVQRAQADIAAREERVRLLQEQVQAAKDEIASDIKEASDASQKIWDGPGAQLEDEYNTRLNQLQNAIAARAKSLNLNYQPDNTYRSPEVWANAYRLALYQTPPGVDNVKEHQWIEDQLKTWRDYTKSLDDRQKGLRDQAAQIKLSPAPKVTDLNNQIDDLNHRIDSTISEEDPIKMELQQAQTDLVESQTAEQGLDAKYYQELYALPEQSITKQLNLLPDGRFAWRDMERDSAFAEGEQEHNYWIFARAIRPDGRQYWALARFTISRRTTQLMVIEPDSFVSTKAILRPDLPPDEQAQ